MGATQEEKKKTVDNSSVKDRRSPFKLYDETEIDEEETFLITAT